MGMPIARDPEPKKILNIATSTGKVSSGLWGTKYVRGTPQYKHTPTEITTDGADPIFVERAPCYMHPLKRILIWTVLIAAVTGGVPALVLVLDDGMSVDGVLFIISMMGMCALAVGAAVLWIAWIFRVTMLWPIVLTSTPSGIRVQLVHRKPWCPLEDLSPSIAVGSVAWISSRTGKPINPKLIHNDLRPQMDSCWLQLSYNSRRRWVLLSLHETPSQAEDAALDWAHKLRLDPERSFTSNAPPNRMMYYHNPKLM